MSDQSELQKAMGHIGSWGRQTVAFAMSLRAQRIGKPIDGPQRVIVAGKEANAVAQDLWESALKECNQPVQPQQMLMKFTAKVFDWVIKHLAD
jgi:hypothetical protein